VFWYWQHVFQIVSVHISSICCLEKLRMGDAWFGFKKGDNHREVIATLYIIYNVLLRNAC
jgi:hypothetical protein